MESSSSSSSSASESKPEVCPPNPNQTINNSPADLTSADVDDEKKVHLEKYLKSEQKIKELEKLLEEQKAEKNAAIKELGFESEQDKSFSAYLERVQQSDVYKSITEGLKVAGGALKDAAESQLVKNIGTGVKKMALGLARSLTQSSEDATK